MFSCVQTTTAEAVEAKSAATVTNTAMSNVFVSDRKPARAGGGSGSTLRDAYPIASVILLVISDCILASKE